MRKVQLSPSDFAWLYDRCLRCWWKKTRGLKQISDGGPPAVTKAVDRTMKMGVTIEELRAAEIPVASLNDRSWVKSTPVAFEDLGVELAIGGYLDRALNLEDGTLGVLDFKMTMVKEDKRSIYWRSLSAYQFAIENPSDGEGQEVSLIGLYCWDPYNGTYCTNNKGRSAVTGNSVYLPMDIDRARFQDFLLELAKVAAMPFMPPAGADCGTCSAILEHRRYEDEMLAREAATSG